MPWWITNVVFPLLPAFIALLVGLGNVSVLSAIHGGIGQGQLFFVAVGLAGYSLNTMLATSGQKDGWTIGALLFIITVSAALYGVATAWKYRDPPRQTMANLIVIGGSTGLLLGAIYIASGIFSPAPR